MKELKDRIPPVTEVKEYNVPAGERFKFQNHYNTYEFPRRYEQNYQPSMTVPDQSMTVKQIMDRFASGLPISGEKVPSYDEEEAPDLDRLDLSERFDLVEANRQRIALMQKDLQDADNKKQEERNRRLEQLELGLDEESKNLEDEKQKPSKPKTKTQKDQE